MGELGVGGGGGPGEVGVGGGGGVGIIAVGEMRGEYGSGVALTSPVVLPAVGEKEKKKIRISIDRVRDAVKELWAPDSSKLYQETLYFNISNSIKKKKQ